jgi:hypothetical protein
MAKSRKRKAKPKPVPAAAGMSRREMLSIVANILGILAYFGMTPAQLFPPSAPPVAPPVALPPTPTGVSVKVSETLRLSWNVIARPAIAGAAETNAPVD